MSTLTASLIALVIGAVCLRLAWRLNRAGLDYENISASLQGRDSHIAYQNREIQRLEDRLKQKDEEIAGHQRSFEIVQGWFCKSCDENSELKRQIESLTADSAPVTESVELTFRDPVNGQIGEGE